MRISDWSSDVCSSDLFEINALQGWFMARIGAYLEKHGRKLIGWDEILEGQVPADATVMSWRGIDGAITAAKAGHDTVLSPAPTLYFHYRSSTSPEQPGAQGTLVDWRPPYPFAPAPARIIPDAPRPLHRPHGHP